MILLTGASGLLGCNLKIEAHRPSHKEFDITDFTIPEQKYDLIVHCAAYTDVERAENETSDCFKTNVVGTFNLLKAYPNTPFVYISSEYAHNPVNFYGLTKFLGEQLVMSHTAPYFIIRTLFKPTPWPYDYAFRDQFTLGDYVDVIAEKIDKEIANWDKKSKLIYIGTGRKSMYDLARETKPDVKLNSIKDIKGVKIPPDYK